MARTRDYDDDLEDDIEPRGRGRGTDGTPPPNYLVPAIAVTLCCCLIGGIIAIVNAAGVNSKWAAGDTAGAYEASAQAKKWCWLSFGIGLPIQIAVVVFQVIAAQRAGQ